MSLPFFFWGVLEMGAELIFDPTTQNPLPPSPHLFYPTQSTNFANFCLICMELDVGVKNVEQSLNLEFEVVGVVYHPPTHSTNWAKSIPNAKSRIQLQ